MVLEGPLLSRCASRAKTRTGDQEIRRHWFIAVALRFACPKPEQETRRSGGTGLLLSRCASRAKTDTANETSEDSVTARKETAPDPLISCQLLAGEAKRGSQKKMLLIS
jgi:hypothetical protein